MSKQQNIILPALPGVEQNVLGIMLCYPETVPVCIELLSSDSFYNKCNRLLFAAVKSLHKSKTPIDLITISEELKRTNKIDEAGGIKYLSEITQNITSGANVEYHCKMLVEKKVLRDIINSSLQNIKTATEGSEDPFELLDNVRRSFDDIKDTIDYRDENKKLSDIKLTKSAKNIKIDSALQDIKDELGIDIDIKNNQKYKTQQVINFLNNKYTFRHNEILKMVEFHNGKGDKFIPFEDRHYNDIHTKLDLANIVIAKTKFERIVNSEFVSPTYNPIKTYIDGLPEWDGTTDHITQYIQQVQLANEEERINFNDTFKKWFVALVGSLVSERVANQHCLVFTGGEGRFKTTWLDNLVPKHLQLDFLFSSRFYFDKKDHYKFLGTKILINLDELATFNRTDTNIMKSVLTDARVVVRLPYGHYDTHMWRLASFCGSTNDELFLHDETGNRRFLIFKIDNITPDKDANIDLCYSQALKLFNSGFKYWWDLEGIKDINKRNENFFDNSIEQDLIQEYLQAPNEKELSTHQIGRAHV